MFAHLNYSLCYPPVWQWKWILNSIATIGKDNAYPATGKGKEEK